jgi:LacI family transcriptional regulator
MIEKNEVTIYDIANALAISPSTVSRALNDLSCRKDTRAKILKKANDLGYRQHPFASKLRSKKTHVIGALVPQFNTPVVSNILSGAEITARQLGYSLFISQSMNNPELHAANMENMNRSRVDGLFMTSGNFQKKTYLQNKVMKPGIPMIVIEASAILDSELQKKANGIFESAYELTVQLAKKGCKRIAYISACADKSVHADLLGGYRQALQDNMLMETDKLILIGYDFEQFDIGMYRILLSMSPRPDGILFSNKTITALSIPEFEMPAANDSDKLLVSYMEDNYTSHNNLSIELGKLAMCILICLVENRHDRPTLNN